jgi:hypothetical protein
MIPQCIEAGSLRICKLIVEYKPYYSILQECGTVLLGTWFLAFLNIIIPASSVVKHSKKILVFKDILLGLQIDEEAMSIMSL